MATTKQIEDYLQKIRRLPSNKLCANCRAPSRLGFSAVCVKYGSFVCDLCKSAHQSYSHRTKSVTMSTWTMDEVKALDEKNGGGNEWCRARWFAKMSESEQARYVPKEGDPLDNYKKFVLMAYEQAKWYDENGKPSGSANPGPAAIVDAKPATTSPSKKTTPAVKMTSASVSKPKPATAADEDLLILDFDAKVTVTPPIGGGGSTPTVAAAADEWGSFTAPGTTPPKTTATANSRASLGSDDEWSFQAAPAVPTAPVVQAPQASTSFDPFAALYAKPPAISMPQPQQPSFGLPPTAPNHATAPSFGAPTAGFPIRGAVPAQPQAPSPAMMMMMGGGAMQKPVVPPAMMAPIGGATPSDDPFSHLHSFNSAPAGLGRTGSLNSAPPPMTGPVATMQRSSSAPANDPFAGLF